MSLDVGFAIIRVLAGLVIAGHGAQKVFGWQGGPGLERWTAGVEKMGFRPHRPWGYMAAFGELVGGLLFAAGLLTGVAAGVLLVDMIVAIWKVHWARGFWNTNGGYEFSLILAVILGAIGLAGAGLYSLDAAIGLTAWTAAMFVVTCVVGLTGMWAGARPAAVAHVEEEQRRRRAA